MFIGVLEENSITKPYLIASRPYYHDCLTWCVQKQQPIPRWTNIFYLCNDARVYLIFLVATLLVIGSAYYFQKCERQKKDWHFITIVALTICVGVSYPYNPRSKPMLILIMIGRFAGILFYTLLGSVLTRLVTVPHLMPQINSITDITNGDFILAGDRFALQKLSQQNEVTTI